jgi:predicted nucleotidyltransferase
MRLLEPLNDIFDQFSKLKILRFLIRTEAELSGREIGSAVGISHVTSNQSLQELSCHGIVLMKKVGPSILYSLNKEHILVTDFLSSLFSKERKLLQSLARAILGSFSGLKPVSLILFGSQIDRDKPRPDSDFDVLCVITDETDLKKFNQEVSVAEALIERKFGNRLSLMVVKKSDFLRRKLKKDPLIQKIERRNMMLFGKSYREIM